MPARYRFSGHESFPCRYVWIPKAYRAIEEDPHVFDDEDGAMAALGVGKNMARAIRFWIQAFGVASVASNGGLQVTPFGRALFSRHGYDPFLEDIRTLWLLHWKLCMNTEEPLFAWDFLLNRWPHPEMSRTEAVRAFAQEAERLGRKLSSATLEQHFDVFLHTYVPTRGAKGEVQEDSLDCPLVELSLLHRVGERRLGQSGKREPIYAFQRGDKHAVSGALFAYCLDEFWRRCRAEEETLSFRDVAVHPNSVGQVFKIPEPDLRVRIEAIEHDSAGAFHFRDSAAQPQVIRTGRNGRDLLAAVYGS